MLKKFQISDPFFSSYQSLIQGVVLPFQYQVLNDALPDVPKSHAVANFKLAAGEETGEFYGMVFQDSDVAKWLEAASYSLALKPDAVLEQQVDELIALVGRAQQPDGYLNTFFTVKEPEHKLQNLLECHELYCSGHMIEAGVAHFIATGKTTLLTIVRKNADYLYQYFVAENHPGIPGHPEIELALCRLYAVTNERRYLDLALCFLDRRGQQPDYFAQELETRGWHHWSKNYDPTYAQSQLPVREQTEAVGHAVRAVYLYTAMADAAAKNGDQALAAACRTLWGNIIEKQLYLTGGIGSTVHGERFTANYDLPNATTYCETCASIGLIFFARKMMELPDAPNSNYADITERALYNTVLAGMSLAGKNFFYVNPLEVDPAYSGKVINYEHVLPQRPAWYGCACCPPNVARLLTSLADYAWYLDAAHDVLYSNLYVGGSLDLRKEYGLTVQVETDYPYSGAIRYTLLPEASSAAKKPLLAVRIPDWCSHASLAIDDVPVSVETAAGYLYFGEETQTSPNGGSVLPLDLTRKTTLLLTLELTPQKLYANLRIRDDAEKCALQYGPLVYCFEGTDNADDLAPLRIKENGFLRTAAPLSALKALPTLEAEGYRLSPAPDTKTNALYFTKKYQKEPAVLRAIPYFTWGNRGETQMKVWMNEIS